MTEKELKRLSRADLLEMLIDQSREVEVLRERVEILQERAEMAEAALERREIIIGSAGSIAEASLRLNGVFEAAQAACEQYIDNIRMLNERQDAMYKQFSWNKGNSPAHTENKREIEEERMDSALRRRRTQRRLGSA